MADLINDLAGGCGIYHDRKIICRDDDRHYYEMRFKNGAYSHFEKISIKDKLVIRIKKYFEGRL